MELHELSEVVFGLVMENRIPVTAVLPDYFDAPYDQGIKILSKKGATREDVAKVLNSQIISDAHDAVHKWNGVGDKENFDWIKALQEASQNYMIGKTLEKAGKKLKENEPVDIIHIYGELQSRITGQSSGLTLASEIDYTVYKPFSKSGNPLLDKILGGFPADGPIIVYGPTGVGKSHWAASTIDYLLHEHKEKTAAIYTLEMSAEHYLWRETNMFPSLKGVLDRLHVSGSVRNIEELVAEVSAKRVDYVVLDDMDNIVKNSDASEYEGVYRRVKEVCRFIKIPFFVLCQPNREAKNALARGDRFLSPYDVAWSGAAENSAALLIGLQKANSVDMAAETFPTVDEDMYYEIFWKSRDGWPGDYNENGQVGPGAIVRKYGKQAWRGDVYAGKPRLWQPNSGGKSIQKKKVKKDES